MKNVILSVALAVSALATSTAFAQQTFDLRCEVENPSEHAAEGDLGYLVPSARVVGSGDNYQIEIARSPARGIEILLPPAVFTDSMGELTSSRAELLWDDGETVFLARSPDGIHYNGTLALEQDFAFVVNCVNVARFHE